MSVLSWIGTPLVQARYVSDDFFCRDPVPTFAKCLVDPASQLTKGEQPRVQLRHDGFDLDHIDRDLMQGQSAFNGFQIGFCFGYRLQHRMQLLSKLSRLPFLQMQHSLLARVPHNQPLK